MEFLNWKNILLEWVNRLEFLGRPCYSLNLAEIDSFYNEFKENITATNITAKKLDSFFKCYYPDFQPLHNKEGKICPEDYVFCYSLMLFFSCVTKPDAKMHKACKSMQEETQLVIKTFLQNLLECNSFSKEAIKAVIETSVPAKMSDYVLALSPNKSYEVDVCPPTPRTKILNEWNTENRQLKALVETERYEKGFLELQLKKKEDQVNALNQERRKFLTDIQELKSQLADKDMENIPPNDNPQMESLKRRLRKEVAEKESEIKVLQNQVIELSSTKQNLAEKFSYMEVQYNKSILSTNELTAKVDEITENCEKQLQHIKGLEITIKEYQKYFNESTSKGNSLDTSSDNLDDSYAAAMANLSIRSMSSPENLGKVVDIQLREQILLYDKLLDKCNQVEQEKFDLNEQLGDRLQQIVVCEAKYRDLEAENSQNVKRYEDKLVEIAALSTESEKNLHELQALQTEFDSLMSKVNESAQRIEDLTGAKSTLEHQLDTCKMEVIELRDNSRLQSEENSSLLLQMERLTADRDLRIVEHEQQMKVASEQIETANARLIAAGNELSAEKLSLVEIIANKENQIQKLIDQCKAYQNDHDNLKETVADLTKQIESLESTTADLASSNEKLISERDTLAFDLTAAESIGNELSIEKLSLTEIIADKENEIQKLVDRCRDYQNDRDTLRETVADLTDQSQSLRSTAAGLVSSNEMLTSERDALTAKLLAAKSIEETLSTEKLSLTEKIADKENEIQKLIDQCNDYRNHHDNLEEALADLTKQIESLNSTVVNLTSSNELLTSERDTLTANLTAATSIEEKLLAEKLSLTEKISDKENEIQKLIDQCKDYHNHHDNLEETVSDLKKQIENLESTAVNLTASNELLTSERDALISNLTVAESIRNELSTEKSSLTETIADKDNQIQKLMDQCTAYRNDHDALQTTVADSTKKIESLETELKVIERLKSEMASLREQSRTLEVARDDLEAQLNVSEEEKEKLFLNLQEKIDEAEATELTLKTLTQKYRAEEAKCESLMEKSKLDFDACQGQINELTEAVADLNADKQQLIEINENLNREIAADRETLTQLRIELQTMHNKAEQCSNEEIQFLNSIEQLKDSKIANEMELNDSRSKLRECVDTNNRLSEKLCSLEQNLEESNNARNQLEQRLVDLEMENSNLKESSQDLEVKREELIARIESAERELASTREESKLRAVTAAELLQKIQELSSESERILVDKEIAEANLRENVDRVLQLTDELDQKKMDLVDKSKSVDTLSEQIEKLKAVECSIVAESTKLSDEYKALVRKLESTESSRDALSVECSSLNEELKTVKDAYDELENRFVDRRLQDTARDDAVKLLETEVEKLKNQIAEMAEVADREQSKLNAKLLMSQADVAAISMKADENEIQRAAKIDELMQTIERLNVDNQTLSQARDALTNQHSQIEIESYQQSTNYKSEIEELIKSKEILDLRVNDLTNETEKLRKDLANAKRDNDSLTDENVDLATDIEKLRTEYLASDESNKAEIDSLKSEVNRLVATNAENHQRIEELQKSNEAKSQNTSIDDRCAKLETDLKIALTDMQSKAHDCYQAQEINKQLVNDNKILSAKLTKHREMTALQEENWQKERTELLERCDKSCQDIRFELEGKLIKMKERMKHIYTEETSKSKEKHEKQERELVHYKNEVQHLTEKVEKYDNHVRTLSRQLYKANEQNLEVKKEVEFLKNKLRFAESNPRESRLFAPPSFGSNFKMEDEEGEVFNNTYLADLKSGISRTSPNGRESIRHSELQQRNSMAARHLRSTYAAQYGDQNLKEEDISMPYFNDSMFSSQLDVRRGTLYQRPGPPTPSKNGGRLSFGGGNVTASDLFPKEVSVLREQNNNAKTKTTPGKLMSMFSSSSKHKEMDRRKSITRPIYSTFTSTPRRKSNWARERKSILAIKANLSQLTVSDDETASVSSNESLFSKTTSRRKSITRQFSIISKRRQGSAVTSMIYKNRREYRERNHSKRLKGFEEGRDLFMKINDDDDINDHFPLIFERETGYLQQNEIVPFYMAPSSEKFEFLTQHTTSEHPYSNEPTAVVEANEASESSLLSTSVGQSKTMSNIIIYGKIPRIKVNETPHRELIHLNHRTDSIWFKLMDVTKQIFVVFTVVVVYASYEFAKFLGRKND